jgi:hypothetical protein
MEKIGPYCRHEGWLFSHAVMFCHHVFWGLKDIGCFGGHSLGSSILLVLESLTTLSLEGHWCIL